jgi:hypothetical protein
MLDEITPLIAAECESLWVLLKRIIDVQNRGVS